MYTAMVSMASAPATSTQVCWSTASTEPTAGLIRSTTTSAGACTMIRAR